VCACVRAQKVQRQRLIHHYNGPVCVCVCVCVCVYVCLRVREREREKERVRVCSREEGVTSSPNSPLKRTRVCVCVCFGMNVYL